MSRNCTTSGTATETQTEGHPMTKTARRDSQNPRPHTTAGASAAGYFDSPTVRWWRVNYWLYAAGGGMTPTWMGLPAESADDAIAKVQAVQNRRDADLGRARCGYFKGATAELLPVESRP